MQINNTLLYMLFKIIQFTGAFLFVTNNLSLNRDDMIKAFSDSSNLISKKNGKIAYDDRAFRDSFKKIYLNRISFLFILISLIMDAFNIKVSMEHNPLFPSIAIIMVSCLFSYLVRIIVSELVDKKEIPPITAKELKVLGIAPDVEIITEKAIEKKIESKAQEIVEKNVETLHKKVDKKVEKILEKKVEEKIEEVKASVQEQDKPKEYRLK